jgi:drug/metabolite transporter (DMT)-like permease
MKMKMNIQLLYLFIFAITFSEGFGQFCLKKAKSNECKYFLLFGILSYAIVASLLFQTYEYAPVGNTNLIWSCLSIFVAFFVGYSFFSEQINKFTILSLFFATLSIYFAQKHEKFQNI